MKVIFKMAPLLVLILSLGSFMYAKTIKESIIYDEKSLVGTWTCRTTEEPNDCKILWKVNKNKTDEFYFICDENEQWGKGTWVLSQGIILQKTNGKTLKGSISWQHQDAFTLTILDNGYPEYKGIKRFYTRTTQKIPANVTAEAPQKSTSAEGHYSPAGVTCIYCFGTGIMTCDVCGGSYKGCSTLGCLYGRANCSHCRGRAVDQSANAHQNAKVPFLNNVVGTWQAYASNDIFTFHGDPFNYGFFLECKSGDSNLAGTWTIEDGLLKFGFIDYASIWQHYWFNSFNAKVMELQNTKTGKILRLTKIK
ncbi:MAG: hypothetical protein RL329_418 [Bacteroidota bacterium]|jgi:hypothetical protein